MSQSGTSVTAEPWTIAKVLSWAADDFRARGIESARLDAELLLGFALGLDRIHLIVESKRPLAPAELSRFRDLIKRRRGGEPMAYILGRREFYGLEFKVDARVLIPRPDTETLVDVALERTRERDMFGNALDLCTGSGCVAIAFAKRRPTWRVTASDLSADALALAGENALRLGVIFALRFVQGDLYAPLGDARFDLVTANPPYIPDPDVPALDPGIRDFEPKIALGGGSDGLELVRRIVGNAPAHLFPGGVLAIEIQHDQGARVHELFERAGFVDIAIRRDYGTNERVVSGRLPS